MISNPNQPAAEPGATRRRWCWWHTVLALVTLVIFAFGCWHVYLHRAIHAELDRIRAEGLPATPEELDAWYEHVPDDQNAALVWLDAFELLHDLPDPDNQELIPYVGDKAATPKLPWEQLTPEQVAILDIYVALNTPAFDRARRAATLTRSRFPVDFSLGLDTPLIHLAPHRLMARALRARGALAVQRHQPADVIDSIALTLALTDSLRGEPSLVSQNVLIGEHADAVAALEGALNHLSFSEEQLLALDASIEEAMNGKPISTGLIGERALFPSWRAYFIKETMDHNEAATATFWRLIGVQQMDDVRYYTDMRLLLDAQSLPCDQRLDVTAAISDEGDRANRYGSYLRFVLPSFINISVKESLATTELTIARLALAVERYRLTYDGHPPDSLDQLVPDYLDAVPLDPFTSDPLHYTTTPDGHYTVYSVGEDLTDDGGARTDATGEAYAPGTDIVFEVRRPIAAPR